MTLNNIKKVYFLGIGGIGMSALGPLLHAAWCGGARI
jgi:UDP-N-acetylmuramate-alanine ligase